MERKKSKDEVKVYTNADLEKYKTEEPEAEETAPAAKPAAGTKEADAKTPGEAADPLQWLQQRKAAQQEQAKALAEAEAAVTAAKTKLANLERQLLATRNPFSARPELSEEEKAKRAEGGETAVHERTKEMVEKAREELRKAEAELARLRAGRP